MKRFGNLYEKIWAIENLVIADKSARKNKHSKKVQHEIAMFDENRDQLLLELSNSIRQKTFVNSKYEVFEKMVDNGKIRTIYRLPYYPDRILHHAIMNVLNPLIIKKLTNDTYSCIKGRGMHLAASRIKIAIRQPEIEYCLKLDIQKFYPSVDHDELKEVLGSTFKDKNLLWLLDTIIESAPGIPIGNYLSQSFANLFLSDFDHWIKEKCGVRFYYRYCDDIVVLGENKNDLHRLRQEIDGYLNNKKLTVKPNWRVFPTTEGIDFLGWVFYPTHTKLRKSIKKNFIKVVIKHNLLPSDYTVKSLASYWGWLKHCDSIRLTKKYLVA